MNWVGNLNTWAWLYYPGNNSTQVQSGKYVGTHPFTATTGEVVQMTKPNIETIPADRIWHYPEIKEVNRSGNSLINLIKYWFVGLLVKQKQKELQTRPLYPTDETGSVYRYSVNNQERSLAQGTDIRDHKAKMDALAAHCPEVKNVVLYGVSRGAAATFKSVPENEYKNVRLAIHEGIPATISAVIKYYFTKWIGKLLYNSIFTKWFIGGQHDVNKSKQAMAQVDSYPNDVPAVFISSKKDRTVPHKSSLNIALALAAKRIKAQAAGEPVAPVYFLQLDHSGHNQYSRPECSSDALRYQNFIHAVYKKHGVPYIEEYAKQGEAGLSTAELTQGLLKQQVLVHDQFKKFKDDRKEIREQAFKSLKQSIDETKISREERNRMISLCSSMSLYAKHRNPYTLFGKTRTQKAIEQLSVDHSASKEKSCCL